MLGKSSAQSIHSHLQPILGDLAVTDAIGSVLAGLGSAVELLEEPNAIPLTLGRITLGYAVLARDSNINDQTALFIQTIAGIITRNHLTPKNRQLTQNVSRTEISTQIQALFAANLNLSQAAADVGVHRNTLSYQLGQASRALGLDPRKFDDAVKLSLAINDN
jgi:hypothetical protein